MNISQSLLFAKNELKDANIESFNLDANVLLSHLLDKPKEFIIFNPEFELSLEQKIKFEEFVARRKKNEPVSHIIQKREFYSREFIVSKDVLDPRADSESLIEYVLQHFNNNNLRFLEIGVGSSCLVTTLLCEMKTASAKAVDISKDAINIAKKNSIKHKVDDRLEIIESDLFSNISSTESFDLIISNPPYIKSSDIDDLQKDVKDFEPIIALDGGDDGLDFYRKIAHQSPQYLKNEGSVIIEIGAGQEEEIIEIFAKNNFNFINAKKDLASIIRVLHFKIR